MPRAVYFVVFGSINLFPFSQCTIPFLPLLRLRPCPQSWRRDPPVPPIDKRRQKQGLEKLSLLFLRLWCLLVTSLTMCPLNESQTCFRDNMDGEDNEERKRTRDYGFLRRLPVNEVLEELTSLGKISCPLVVTSLLIYSRSIISMLFLGHLGNIELAGGSLSMGFANITGYSVIKGLSMGMEPLCCQAYGAKRLALLSQTYQKTLLLLILAVIPISLLWLKMEYILLFLGQDQTITSVAGTYIIFSIPDLLAQAHLHPLRSFLRSQSLTTPLTVAAATAMILHLPINYFLVIYLKLGVRGVALASACNSLNLNLGLLLYLALSKTALKPWKGIVTFSFIQGWRPLLTLALPSALSVCLEWWWYEIVLFLCGFLSNPQVTVAAMGVLIQTTGFLYVFPYSLSLGLSTRVGHELGAGQPARAQWAAIVGLTVAFSLGVSAFGFTSAVRYSWGKMFTCDAQILALISVALPILGFCELGNYPQTTACGVLTGSARPKIGARINFCSFYLVGLPTAALMAFTFRTGFLGLLFGLFAAQASCMCMMLYTLICTDWKHQAKRAKELTQAAGENDLEVGLLH